jgi:hypothetical protein
MRPKQPVSLAVDARRMVFVSEKEGISWINLNNSSSGPIIDLPGVSEL